MSTLETWPFCIPARIHMSPESTSLFPISAFLYCPSFNCLTIRISGVGIKALTLHDLDTINDAEIDRTALSWTVRPGSRHRAQLPTRLELRFATLRLLESFLFALSYVRYTASTSNHSVSIVKARRVVLAEADDSYLDNLSEIFLDMRASPADNCLIHSLPPEMYPLSSSSALPKIRLGVEDHCHRNSWAVADTLLRSWPFIFRPSRQPSCSNGFVVSESEIVRHHPLLTVEDVQYLPHETFDVGQNNLAFFAPVHTLRISSPHSQLYDLLGAGGSLMPALRSLSLFILRWDPSKWTRLCQSAPLLRDLTIQAEGLIVSLRLSPGFISAFQWSQLTVLTLKLDLGISVWVLLFSQCTSLRTGRFIVWNEGPDPHYPAVPIALNHLESLRVTFRGACDLTFFDHLTFPAIQKLHVTGLISGLDLDAAFIPRLPTLDTLFLDVPDLPPSLLENIIRSHPPLEHLSFIVDSGPDHYTAVFQRLRRDYRLRTLAISTSVGDDLEELRVFTEHVVAWAVPQVSTFDCEFRLYGKTKPLDALKNALAGVETVKAGREFVPDVDGFDDPFAIFPYSRTTFLSVCMRSCTDGAAPSCIVSNTQYRESAI
ncbi:hypothetical protein B0H13DRAFT_1922015 [Mycena leptocephala]|nr:hypothetical protein B0H13DRAFT_1922015 [Mycena leptocephala]